MDKCLSSAVNQSFEKDDYEIIVINDASTDNSNKIIKRYVNKYSNVLCIRHEANSGLSNARNSGMNIARGEYILFLDGDDYIDKETLEILYKQAISQVSDIVICGFKKIDSNGNILLERSLDIPTSNDLILHSLFEGRLFNVVWGMLIKAELTEFT